MTVIELLISDLKEQAVILKEVESVFTDVFPGEHHPRVQPERALPEVQEAHQDQRRQGGPVPVPPRPRGGGARAGGRGGPDGGGGARIQEGQIETLGPLEGNWVLHLPPPLNS